MHELIVVGAGGFGREVFNYALDAGLEVRGFVDDDASAGKGRLQAPLLGSVDEVAFDPDGDRFLIGVGDPGTRRLIAERVSARGGLLGSVVHPTAYVARDADVAAGCLVCPFALLATNARVMRNVAVNTYASIGHDAIVGAHTVLSPYSVVNGNVELGESVFLGTHATVTPGRRVGRNSKIAAGAVASRDVEAGFLVSGNPARGRAMFPTGND